MKITIEIEVGKDDKLVVKKINKKPKIDRKKTTKQIDDEARRELIYVKQKNYKEKFYDVARNILSGGDETKIRGTSYICQCCRKKCLIKAPVYAKEDFNLYVYYMSIIEKVCKDEFDGKPNL